MMSEAQAPASPDHPLMVAWETYKQTEAFANTRKWAAFSEHVDGALWAAFEAGVVSTFEQRAKDLKDVYARARAEAFEEAARVAESTKPYSFRDTSGRALTAKEIAATIRALAKEPPK